MHIKSNLPKKILTNKDLESIVDTTDEWIVERTGIRFRHIAEDDETTSSLAIEAAEKAGMLPIKLNVIPFLADILNRTKNKNGNIIGKNDTSKFILSTSIENIQYK
mgnify:CR=1 FL=1